MIETDRTIAHVLPFVSRDGTRFPRLQHKDLLNASVERVLFCCADAVMVQLEVHFNEGATDHVVHIEYFNNGVFCKNAERCSSISPFDFVKVTSKVHWHGPFFSVMINFVFSCPVVYRQSDVNLAKKVDSKPCKVRSRFSKTYLVKRIFFC